MEGQPSRLAIRTVAGRQQAQTMPTDSATIETEEPAIKNPTADDLDQGDFIRFLWERGNGDTATGYVMAVGRSGTVRVRGIGTVDVDAEDVVEVIERSEDR